MAKILKQHYRIMARLGVEPRPSGYIPGALPIELPSPGYKVVLVMCTGRGNPCRFLPGV